MDIAALLISSMKNQASDLHLSAGLSPRMRIHGDLHIMASEVLSHDDILKIVLSLMNDKQKQQYKQSSPKLY